MTSIVDRAREWLAARPTGGPVHLVCGAREAGRALVRAETARRGAVSGWRVSSLDGLAHELAGPTVARRGLRAASRLSIEAITLEVVARAAEAGRLGRFAPLAHRRGLARTLARVLVELREADVGPAAVTAEDAALAGLLAAALAELEARGLVDRGRLFELATRAALASERLGPVLFCDVPMRSRVEVELVRAVLARSEEGAFCARTWDRPSFGLLADDLGARLVLDAPEGGLGEVAACLFTDGAAQAPADLRRFSAATEEEEALEIAARIQEAAGTGVRYAEMAVLLRDPAAYRAPLETALGRAGIPLTATEGARRPDPTGRAFLALLDCKLEGLSARAFAEYLSFPVLPPDVAGAPPEARSRADGYAEDDEPDAAISDEAEPTDEDEAGGEERSVRRGALRAPRRFEALLSDAAVIGGAERWERRLAGLRAQLERALGELDDRSDPAALALTASLADLDALARFALPLVRDLATLPDRAPLAEHADRLSALASRALARPERVLAVLSEVARSGGAPRSLEELRRLLAPLLSDVTREVTASSGAVTVASIDEARGRAFDWVFLPGVAAGVFPGRLVEDAVLRDAVRERLSPDLATRATRAEDERNRLRLAVSAARKVLVVSHPRLDAERGRPRVPSLYLLELVRAATGVLPSAPEAAPEADRLPLGAPREPSRAIDATERDVATVSRLLARAEAGEPVTGLARYLVDGEGAPRMLHRALAARWRRQERRSTAFGPADGEVGAAVAEKLLARHAPSRRVVSATALESFVACPYRFHLGSVLRLRAREVAEPLVELDPLLRGSIIHELAYAWLSRMRDEGKLPLDDAGRAHGRAVLDTILAAARTRLHDDLVPALPSVFDDELDRIGADLVRWIDGLGRDGWQPLYFELGFGRPGGSAHDPASRPEPVALPEVGLTLRGSIDLVEVREGPDGRELRATDLKTGKASQSQGIVIAGGRALQPALYALALEKLVPDARVVGGRLHYATRRGGFSEVLVPLSDDARTGVASVVRALEGTLRAGQLVRWPSPGECRYCDYRTVCGDDEERRTQRKIEAKVRLPLVDDVRGAR